MAYREQCSSPEDVLCKLVVTSDNDYFYKIV